MMSYLLCLSERPFFHNFQIFYPIQWIRLIKFWMIKLSRLIDIWFDGKKEHQLVTREKTKVYYNRLTTTQSEMRSLLLLTRWSRALSNSGSMALTSRYQRHVASIIVGEDVSTQYGSSSSSSIRINSFYFL